MERICESFGVEIERGYSDMDDDVSGMGLKMKESVLKMIWAMLTMLGPTDSIHRKLSIDRFSRQI